MVATSLLVAEINNITHGNDCHFVKWPPETSKWLITSTYAYDKMIHDVFGNTFSEVCAPQYLYIESNLKALNPLVSEIDVYYFENGRDFFKWPLNWRIQWHDVFGNTFSEVYAPQNQVILMLPVDTTMAVMCHVLFVCRMFFRGSGCRCDYCMFSRSVDTCRRPVMPTLGHMKINFFFANSTLLR